MTNTKQTMRDIVRAMEAEGKMIGDISHRGGTYGAYATVAVGTLFPTLSEEQERRVLDCLPNKIGAFCNYLGGGLRGAIVRSDYAAALPAKYARRIDAFTRECVRRYNEIENGEGLNEETYPDGDTNWEAQGTKKVRAAGVKSAY